MKKKCPTAQSFICKELTSYKICILDWVSDLCQALVRQSPKLSSFLDWEVFFNLLSSLMNSFSMIFENIFSWKSHVTFVAGCPCFFLHYFWMADIDMSHPVLSIRKFTWACWTPAEIWKIDQIINFRFPIPSVTESIFSKIWQVCVEFSNSQV